MNQQTILWAALCLVAVGVAALWPRAASFGLVTSRTAPSHQGRDNPPAVNAEALNIPTGMPSAHLVG